MANERSRQKKVLKKRKKRDEKQHERTPLDEAQDLKYEAWESRDPRKRASSCGA